MTPSRPRQRGAALLMAMVIVTLVSTLAASMIYQQARAVQVEEAERVRAQGEWILKVLLDWGRHFLRDDARRRPAWDDLTETWATEVPESRISAFLAADQNNNAAGEMADDGFVSGKVIDAQGKFNLRNLLDPDVAQRTAQLEIFRRLCTNVGVAAGIADLIAQRLTLADLASQAGSGNAAVLAAVGGPSGVAAAPLMPAAYDDLLWLGQGLTADLLEKLRPFVTLLPNGVTNAKVNVNTAPPEVIAAAVPNMTIGIAARIESARQRKPIRNWPADLQAVVGQGYNLDALDIKSSYYEPTYRLRMGDFTLVQRNLLERSPQAVRVLSRVRMSGMNSN